MAVVYRPPSTSKYGWSPVLLQLIVCSNVNIGTTPSSSMWLSDRCPAGRCVRFPVASITFLDQWFVENSLLVNPAKTEEILFGIRAQQEKTSTSGGVDVAGSVVPYREHIKLLGVTLDACLTMDRHVTARTALHSTTADT